MFSLVDIMPKAKICCSPGCNKLIPVGKAYCDKCQPPARIPFQNAIRSNEGLYNTNRWRKLRKKVLSETPYCIKCGADSGLEIHHKIPPRGDIELFYEESNCVPVCRVCHRKITAREILGRR